MSRRERSAMNSRGRPKRRAATTNYLFKYQLSGDPGRIEEIALKKALQESLEEHKSTPSPPLTAGAAVIAREQTGKNNISKHNSNNNINNGRTSNGVKVNNKRKQQQQQQQHGRATINSSTNSSDVSKVSNDSTTTTATTSSSEIGRDTSPTNDGDSASGIVVTTNNKRLRSSATSSIITPTPSKRAKLTTNGHSNTSRNNNNNKCDINDTSVLTGSPVPLFNRSVHKTYSRSLTNGHSTSTPSQLEDGSDATNPRTSTPISSANKTTLDKRSPQKEPSKPSVSKSTQTAVKSFLKTQRNKTSDYDGNSSNADLGSATKTQQDSSTSNGQANSVDTPGTLPPIQNQYLKLKRESKNYAYAKMTALQVAFSGPARSSSNSSKKGSPSGGALRLGSVSGSASKKSPSPIGASTTKSSAELSIAKSSLSATSQGVNNHTIDLSSNNNQAEVNLMKKRSSQGSWSLLGVPEEKVLYIRDDEPPRRLICYPAIKHVEGDVIQVRDSVLLRSGAKQTDLPYVAKVCAFWRDAQTGDVMMSLYWYYRPEHTEEGRKPHQLIDDIFASRHRDVDSVDCIEDKCYVLTFNEYCRYRKRVKMEQVNTTWSLTDVTIPVSNESYPRRNRIPDSNVNPELVFCCRQIYDSRNRRLVKNPHINPKYGHI